MRKILLLCVALVMMLVPAEYATASRSLNRLVIGTSSIGGTYFVWGAGWSRIMNEHVDNVHISVQVTGGPITNMQLMQRDDMELGFVTTWLGGEAWSGTGWADGVVYDRIRGMFANYYSVLYIYTLEGSGIYTVHDFEGRNISVGAPGATSDLAGRAVLDALGITPNSVTSMPTGAQVSSLKDGIICASFSVTGIPGPFMLELETTHDVRIIALTDEDFDIIFEKQPYWAREIIPANTFRNQPVDIPVAAFWNMMIAHKDLDDDLVYKLVYTTFAQHEALIAVDPTAAQTVPEAISRAVVPLHPGALRFYQERGIYVPARLILD